MGICPSFSPQQRAIAHSNRQLLKMLQVNLKDLYMYNFSGKLRSLIPEIPPRYLLNQGIIQDIEKIRTISLQDQSIIKSTATDVQNFQQDLQESCLILQDEALNNNAKDNQFSNPKGQNPHNSFQVNLAKHQSLVVQMNIIYQNDFQIDKYRNSLKLFLKWSSVFQEHSYGGFLKPVYRQFCQSLYKIPIEQLDTVVDQTNIFVQYMVTIYTQIYYLKNIYQSANGELFKNQNVFNLIMSFLFRRTKIKKFARKVIRTREKQKIEKFRIKLEELRNKNINFFGVEKKFILQSESLQQKQNRQQFPINSSGDVSQVVKQNVILQNQQKADLLSKEPIHENIPYSSCFKLVQQLCQDSALTPISKLKIIVSISKKIMGQIYQHHDKIKKQVPDLDPDNLTAIIMYLIVKAGRFQLLEELKIVEYFTTTNCLNCISGFYLNTFSAAIQSLLEL